MGILAAQSIGETGTQLSLISFHSVGYTNTALSQGVPRLRALIGASKSKYFIYMLKTAYSNIKELNKIVGSSVQEVKLRHLVRLVDVIDNTTPQPG